MKTVWLLVVKTKKEKDNLSVYLNTGQIDCEGNIHSVTQNVVASCRAYNRKINNVFSCPAESNEETHQIDLV